MVLRSLNPESRFWNSARTDTSFTALTVISVSIWSWFWNTANSFRSFTSVMTGG